MADIETRKMKTFSPITHNDDLLTEFHINTGRIRMGKEVLREGVSLSKS